MLSTSVSYQRIAANIDRSLSLKAAEKPVALEVAYYREKIGGIKSIDAFLKDTRLFRFAMTAFGLEDMAHAKGFIRKILTEGIDDPKAFARRLADDRFVAFATAFNFAANGEATTSTEAAQQGAVDRYVRQKLEVSVGEENEALRLALYFERTAPQVKTAYGILADPALWKVVQTVFGFPKEMANADIAKQAAAVLQRLDIADLQDPEKLNRFIRRFASVWDATTASASDPVLSLFATNSPAVGFDLIVTLRNLKHGGV